MSQKVDDVRIEFHSGAGGHGAAAKTTDAKLILYTLKVENDKGALRLERRLKLTDQS